MKKYLVTAESCQKEKAVLVHANSIDDVISMLRRGAVDLSGGMDVDWQFNGFDIKNEIWCEVIVSYRRDFID